MLILWLTCLLTYQTDSTYYEGTLTVTDRSGPCEAQPESQRVMLVMNEESDRIEGYLAFTDKRLAKIEGKPGEPLLVLVTFPAADSAWAEVWHWNLERVENGLAGHLEGKRFPDIQDCHTKQAFISLVAREPFRTNFDQRARQFQALGMVAQVDVLLAKEERAKAFEVIEQTMRLASDREEVHFKAAELALEQDDLSDLMTKWYDVGMSKGSEGLDFRYSVAWFLLNLSANFVEKESREKALRTLKLASPFKPDSHKYLALAGEICRKLGEIDEAFDYFQAAVGAIIPRLDEEPELRQELGNYHIVISEIRSPMPVWALSKLAEASVLPDLPESQGNLESWEKVNSRIAIAQREGSYQLAILTAEENYQNAVLWFGASHPNTVTSINNLAALYIYLGDYDVAKPLIEDALRYCREVLGGNHPFTLTSLNNLGEIYQYQGAYETAKPLHEEALRLGREVLGIRHPNTLISLNNLANLYQNQGSYEAAQPLFEELLRLRKEILGGHHPDTLLALNNLAGLYQSQGAYEAAQPLFEEVLNLRKEVLGKRHPDTLDSLSNLAGLFLNQGAYEAAQPLYQEVLRLRKEVLGEHHPDTLSALNNLAVLFENQGAYEAAQPLYLEALRLRREVLGDLHPNTLISINNLAGLYFRQGAFGTAQPLCEEALRISKEALGVRHPDTLRLLNNLAVLYQSQGFFEEARTRYLEALKISKEALGKKHPNTLNILTNLAGLSALLEGDQTSEYLLEAAQSSTAYLQRISGFDARTRRTFLKTNHESLRHILFSYFSQKSSSSLPLEILSFGMTRKGLLFQMASDIHRAAMAESKHDGTTALQQLQRCRTELSANTQRAVLGLNTQDADPRLMRELERLERELGRQLSQITSTDQVAEKVINAIPDDTILVDFHVFSELNFETSKFLDERLIAFIVNPQLEQNIRLVKMESPLAEIRKDVEAFRKAISSTDRPSLLKKASERLYGHIWKPLAPYLGDKRKVYLVPDGVLHLVPWGALKDENGRYLAATTNIAVLASGMDLIRNQDPVLPKSGQPHLVFAPNYDLELGEATHPLSNIDSPFDPLDGALEEGIRLTDLFRKYGKKPITRERDEANETWVSQLKSPSLLHFATHGQFWGSKGPSLEGRSANGPLLRDLEQIEARVYSEFLPGERPMLASGLALAGANGIVKGRRAEDHTDGLLSAFEVLSMDLRGTDLVVLSACDTGLGEVNNGDGVYSLNRAFLEAGAKNVLATLWKIDDKATVDFMENFYELYLQGHAPREALRLTQIKFMASETYAHPYYWAPFVLVGPD